MNAHKIALIVDSCSDIPEHILKKHNIYRVPLHVNYENEQYLDGVDITPAQILERMLKGEVPSTSTPTPAAVQEMLRQVVADGYEQAVIVNLAAGLSHTYDLMLSVAVGMPEIRTLVIDSRTVSLGAGMVALEVARMLEHDATLEEIEQLAPEIVDNHRIFFCVDTLEYLFLGGRVNRATYKLGGALDIRPLLSCAKDGAFHMIGVALGRCQSRKKIVKMAGEYIKDEAGATLAGGNSAAQEEADQVLASLKKRVKDPREVYENTLCSAVLVHAGPGLVGIGIQKDCVAKWLAERGKPKSSPLPA